MIFGALEAAAQLALVLDPPERVHCFRLHTFGANISTPGLGFRRLLTTLNDQRCEQGLHRLCAATAGAN